MTFDDTILSAVEYEAEIISEMVVMTVMIEMVIAAITVMRMRVYLIRLFIAVYVWKILFISSR